MPPAIVGHSNPDPNPMDRPNPLTKPHLVKQRRRARSSKPPMTGFNPFYTDSDPNSSLVDNFNSSKNAGDSFSSNSGDSFSFGANSQSFGPFVFGDSTRKLPERNLRNVGDEKENKPVFVFGGSENSSASLDLHDKVQAWHPFGSTTSDTGYKENSGQHGPFVFGKKPKENPSFLEKIPESKMGNLKNSGNETTSGNFIFGTSSSSSNDKDETDNMIYLEKKLEKEVPVGSSSAPKEKDENVINDPPGTNSESFTHQKEGNPTFAFGSSKADPESVNVENKLPEMVKNLNLGIGTSNKESKQGTFLFGVDLKKSTVSSLDENMKNMDIGKEKKENSTSSNFSFNYSNILPDEIQKLHIGTERRNPSKARLQRNARHKKERSSRPCKVRNPSGAHQIPTFVPTFNTSTNFSEQYESVSEPVPVPVPEPTVVPVQVPIQEPVPVPVPDSPASYSPMDCSPYPSNENPNENANELEAELVSATEQLEIKGENPNEKENENPKIDEKKAKDANEASGSFEGFAFNASNPLDKEEGKKGFAFSASISAQDPAAPVRRRHFRRMNRNRGVSAGNLSKETRRFVQPGGLLTNKIAPPGQENSNTSKTTTTEREPRKESAGTSSEALETCEKWRSRGNQAYAKGKLNKAEEYYTRGIQSVPSSEASGRSLMLCFSNRAAARMASGRTREAFQDCLSALGFDSQFLRAQLRAANCLLALGEFDDAVMYYNRCVCSHDADSKVLAEASQGLARAQKMIEYLNTATELLKKKSPPEVTRALDLISDALLTATNSDDLLKMKAQALLLLRRYDDMIELCEQSLESAQKNSNSEIEDPRLWRWCLVSKAYFYLGKLEEALELLKKHEQVQPISANRCGEYSAASAAIIGELLRLKGSGNELYQARRFAEAVESYSAALTYNGESCGFSAICFGNRAAAYQALGQVMDAIADCSLAIALHPNYAKAISRRAALYEMIRDYGQAANDLRRLISLLNNTNDNNNNNNYVELNQAQIRLSSMEEESRKRTPLNMYLILGVERSSSGADVKKAYRKAALRHHPDKAGQFLVRSETLDDSVWSEITNEVHRDADHLFKIIGEAYNVLSDPAKRLEYETEEEMKSVKRAYYNGTSRRPKSPEEQNSKQQWRPWRPSRNRHQWSESYDPYW